jgi:transposase
MVAIAITRLECSAAELRREATRTQDAAVARRLLALALVLEGRSRTEAAASCGMDRQTLCDWVHRYNESGIAGLANHKPPGPRPCLTAAEAAVVKDWVSSGPDLAQDGVVRWRCVDLRDKIAGAFGVHLHERSIGKLLHRLDFRHLSVRPQHPKSDPAAQETCNKTSLPW